MVGGMIGQNAPSTRENPHPASARLRGDRPGENWWDAEVTAPQVPGSMPARRISERPETLSGKRQRFLSDVPEIVPAAPRQDRHQSLRCSTGFRANFPRKNSVHLNPAGRCRWPNSTRRRRSNTRVRPGACGTPESSSVEGPAAFCAGDGVTSSDVQHIETHDSGSVGYVGPCHREEPARRGGRV